MPSGKGRSRPTSQEQAQVTYLTVRDRFLSASEDGDYAEWLCQVGRFVHHCWLAEEAARDPNQPFDEHAVRDKWDKSTERELRELRRDGVLELNGYATRRLIQLVSDWMLEHKLEKAAAAFWWVISTMVTGFVSGIGLIVLGLLFVLLAPHTAKSIRSALDDALPEASSPHVQSGCPAGHSHASDPQNCP